MFKGGGSCHGNLQEEILVSLHYFLALLHRSFEGCGCQPWAASAMVATFPPPHKTRWTQEEFCNGWLIVETKYPNS